MHYSPKHASPRPATKVRSRMLGMAVAGGAAIATMATASPAQAAPAAPGNVWDRVAACESGGNWSIATGNGYYGGLQFSLSSWRAAGGARYASSPNRASKAQQIAVAQNLLRMQGPGAWPVCSRRAGLTKANGLASGGGAAVASRSAVRTKAKSNRGGAFLAYKDVRNVQSWLGMARTGRWSKALTIRLQKKVGARPDGIIGPQTVRMTERHIGAKRTGLSYFNKATYNKLAAFAAAR